MRVWLRVTWPLSLRTQEVVPQIVPIRAIFNFAVKSWPYLLHAAITRYLEVQQQSCKFSDWMIQTHPSNAVSPAVYQYRHLSTSSDFNCFIFIQRCTISSSLPLIRLKVKFTQHNQLSKLSRPLQTQRFSDDFLKYNIYPPQSTHYTMLETELPMSLFDNFSTTSVSSEIRSSPLCFKYAVWRISPWASIIRSFFDVYIVE